MRDPQPPLRWTTWVFFLLANVVVSAVTSFLVVRGLVTAYSQPQLTEAPAPSAVGEAATPARPPEPQAPTNAPTEQAPTATPEAMQPRGETAVQPSRTAAVRIVNVLYPGQSTREAVVLANEGEEAVDLTGWTLSNPRGQTYTFAQVVLPRNGLISVYTTRGADSPSGLFWNLDRAVWQVGDTVTLKRGEEVVATFVVGR